MRTEKRSQKNQKMLGRYIFFKEQESLNSESNRKLYLEVDLKYDSSWHGIY